MQDGSIETDLDISLRTDLDSSIGTDLDSSLRTDLDSSIGTDLGSSLRTDLDISIGTDLDSSLRTDLDSSFGSDLVSSLRNDLDGSSRTDLVSSQAADLVWPLVQMSLPVIVKNTWTMETTIEQQVALDEALIPSTKRLRIGKSNFKLPSDIQSKESTLQVIYDVLRSCPFFKAFLVTTDVSKIYMQEFWATVYVHQHSIRFKLDNKKYIVDLETFRDMLHICPRIHGQSFDELPFKAEILEFLRFLGHSAQIRTLTDLTAAAKGKQPAKAKSLSDPSELARTEAQQLKIVLRRSRQETHISQHGSSSTYEGTDEGTGSKPGVPDVPTDDSEEELSWNSSDNKDVGGHEEGNKSDESDDERDEGSDDDSDETVKAGAGKDDDNNDDEDDDDNDEEEELAKSDEEDTETGKGGDEVRESEGESDEEETRQEEEESFDPI
nr:hypothetical protein [Tanacetum cinerariifolium]